MSALRAAALCVVTLGLFACEGCEGKSTGGTVSSASASASGSAAAKSEVVRLSEDYAAATCACADAHCVTEAAKAYGVSIRGKTPTTDADRKAMADLARKASTCAQTLATTAPSGGPAPSASH